HAAIAGRHTENDRIVVRQIVDGRDGRGLVELETRLLRDLLRNELRYALDVDLRAGLAGACGNGLGHLLDVAIARIVENQNLAHDVVSSWSGRGFPCCCADAWGSRYPAQFFLAGRE